MNYFKESKYIVIFVVQKKSSRRGELGGGDLKMVKTRDRQTSENCDNPEKRFWRPELRQWPWKQREEEEERKYSSCSEGDPRLMD